MVEVNERTTSYLTVTFKDKAGTAVAPSSATYRIDCATTGQAVKPVTALGAGAAVEITITPAENAIVNAENVLEIKRVTVVGVYGPTDEVTADYDYLVRNLKHVP